VAFQLFDQRVEIQPLSADHPSITTCIALSGPTRENKVIASGSSLYLPIMTMSRRAITSLSANLRPTVQANAGTAVRWSSTAPRQAEGQPSRSIKDSTSAIDCKSGVFVSWSRVIEEGMDCVERRELGMRLMSQTR
jgi:hypothetical protein